MKKKKIKKRIILLSMIMIIINTTLPSVTSAAEYTTGDLLYEINNGNADNTQEIFSYLEENIEKINNGIKFVKIKINDNTEEYAVRALQTDSAKIILYTTSEIYPNCVIHKNGTAQTGYKTAQYNYSALNNVTPYQVLFYEIIEIVPTPSPSPTPSPTPSPSPSPSPTPSPTPDERVTNMLNETGKGVGTILTWVGDLWEGITTGEMSAILPIFVIFIAIPLILLVIKIIRKTTWGD